MSQEFTTVLVAPLADSTNLILSVEIRLADLGFRLDPRLCRVEFDSERGVFDETADAPLSINQSLSARNSVAEWLGFATEVWSEDLMAYVLVGRTTEWINVYIDLDLGAIRRMARTVRESLYPLLETIAQCFGAKVGFSDVNLSYKPVSRAQALKAIGNNPENPGFSSSLGLISADTMSNAEITVTWGDTFTVEQRPSGYWILIHNDFLDNFAE